MRHLSPLQTKGMRLRIRLLAGVLAVGCLGGLVGRLAVLQLVDADGYAARASDQQLRGATLPAARGEITSADGTLLAASRQGLDIACGSGVLRLRVVQREGGKAITAADYLNARRDLVTP